MNIHALQYNIAWEDKPANHRKIRAMLQSSPPHPNDLLILPEMFSTGFSMNLPAITDTPSHQDQTFLSQLARDYQIHILAGIATTGPDRKAHNQSLLLSPTGAELARYTKLHPFSPGKEPLHFLPGHPSQISSTSINGLHLTPFICYDLRFPEIFRHAALHLGTQCFIVIANWPTPRIDHWTTLLRARAIENQAYVIGLNRTGSDPYLSYPGFSIAISPKGETLAELADQESTLLASLNPNAVQTWRKEFPALTDARPELTAHR